MGKIILANRTDQDGFTNGYRGYDSAAARESAIRVLRIVYGANYFVCYRDVQSPFALMFGHAAWVPEGRIHVNR
jgi:hypothetical protein